MSSMKIVSDTTEEVHTHTRRLEIEDAPIEQVPEKHWTHKGKSFQPDRVLMTWGHGGEPLDATVFGTVLKANGDMGVTRIKIEYFLSEKSTSWRRCDAPAWLRELVAA